MVQLTKDKKLLRRPTGNNQNSYTAGYQVIKKRTSSVLLLIGVLFQVFHYPTELCLVVKPELAVTSQGAPQTRTSFLLPRLLLPPQSSSCEGDKKQNNALKMLSSQHKFLHNVIPSSSSSFLLASSSSSSCAPPPWRHPPPRPSPGMPLSDRAPPCGQASFRSRAPTKKNKKKTTFFWWRPRDLNWQ